MPEYIFFQNWVITIYSGERDLKAVTPREVLRVVAECWNEKYAHICSSPASPNKVPIIVSDGILLSLQVHDQITHVHS